MVDVAPTSQKLIERAKGLVMELGAIDYEEAGVLLDQTGFRVKPAVIMARAEVSLEEAERRLEAAGGRLRLALEGDRA